MTELCLVFAERCHVGRNHLVEMEWSCLEVSQSSCIPGGQLCAVVWGAVAVAPGERLKLRYAVHRRTSETTEYILF